MRQSTSAYVSGLIGLAFACSCGDSSTRPTQEGTGSLTPSGFATAGSSGMNGGATSLGEQLPSGGGSPNNGASTTAGSQETPVATTTTSGAESTTTGAVTTPGGDEGPGSAMGVADDMSAAGNSNGAGTSAGLTTGNDSNGANNGGSMTIGSDSNESGNGGSMTIGSDSNESGGAGGTGTGPSAGGDSSAAGDGNATSPGCGSTNTTSPCSVKGTTCSLDVDGTERAYYVQLPSDYDSSTPYPVIFQFHPWGGSADQALTMYQLNSKIPEAIYVTPQGLDAGGNGPGWANTDGQDIAFTEAMLDDVQSNYCVDNARLFSTGFSYGGMMSFAIGCEMSDVFRAIAPMSGSLYSDFNCQGSGPPIAMWGSHGLSDTVVPIDDGRAALAKILQENHCGTETMPVEPSQCVKYQGCDPGYDVTWCEWDGPHGIPSFGSSAIAEFFKQFLR